MLCARLKTKHVSLNFSRAGSNPLAFTSIDFVKEQFITDFAQIGVYTMIRNGLLISLVVVLKFSIAVPQSNSLEVGTLPLPASLSLRSLHFSGFLCVPILSVTLAVL